MIHGLRSIKNRLLSSNSAIATRADKHRAKHEHNSTARGGYNTDLRSANGIKANNDSVSRRAQKIAISGLGLALLGQTAADYTSIAQTILQLMTIAIPIFVVIAVVRMIFRHLRD
jgi:hypothetical protein